MCEYFTLYLCADNINSWSRAPTLTVIPIPKINRSDLLLYVSKRADQNHLCRRTIALNNTYIETMLLSSQRPNGIELVIECGEGKMNWRNMFTDNIRNEFITSYFTALLRYECDEQ